MSSRPRTWSRNTARPFTKAVMVRLAEVEPPMASAFRETISRLRKRGLTVKPLPITPLLNQLVDEARLVEFYEGARFHEQRFKQYGDRLLDLAELVRSGLKISDQ